MASSLISLITVSNSFINNHLAAGGQMIKITATYNSIASSISGTLNGNTLSFSHIGGTFSYVAYYTVSISDTQGNIALNIVADTVTSTSVTDGMSVAIDTQPPVASVIYTTTGASVSQPIVGDIHTLNIQFDEQLLSVPRIGFGYVRTARVNNITTSNAPVYLWIQLDNYTWQATYTITGNEIMPPSLLINATDLAGNIGIFDYPLIPQKIFDYYHTYYYYDEFFNDNQGRYYANGTGAHSIVSPPVIGENGIGKFVVIASGDYAGYNISKNYLTFLYQSYDWFQINFYISDIAPSVSGDTAKVRIGFVDSDAATPNYGIYFETDIVNNRWETCTALAGSVTSHSIVNAANVLKSGTTHAHLLTITYDGINAYYSIDGVSIDTIAYNVANPIGSGVFPSLGFYITKTAGTTQTNYLNVDFVELTLKRYTEGDFNNDFSNDFFN